MAKVKVKLNRLGVANLLKSSEMQAGLSELANGIMSRAGGDGYATDTRVIGTRAVASVSVVTDKAMHDNYENNTLLKALK